LQEYNTYSMHFSTNFIVGILHRLDELFWGDEDEVVRVILEFAEKKYKLNGLLTNVKHDDDGPIHDEIKEFLGAAGLDPDYLIYPPFKRCKMADEYLKNAKKAEEYGTLS